MSIIQYSTDGIKMGKPCSEPIKIIFYDTVYNPEQNVPDRLRILFIENGAGTCEINNITYPWVAPCLICLNEKQKITHLSVKSHIWSLYFHPEAINSRLSMENIYTVTDNAPLEVIENAMLFTVFTQSDGVTFLNHISPELSVRIRFLLESIKNQLVHQETAWWPCLFRSYLTELLILIGRKDCIACTQEEPDLHQLKVSADFAPVLDFVMNYYHEKISLDDLAREFGTNRTSLNKWFKEETGMTAIAYLKDLRLRIASTMLLNTNLPVSEIAERAGISDISYFERIFRHKYAQSPTSYRSSANGSKNSVTAAQV